FAYNSAQHDAIGYTPVYLNLGRELLSLANATNTKQYYNPRHSSWKLRVGHKIYKKEYTSSKSVTFNAKLAPRFKGLHSRLGAWYPPLSSTYAIEAAARRIYIHDFKLAPSSDGETIDRNEKNTDEHMDTEYTDTNTDSDENEK
ncbi:hypothetical protein ALC56_13146, partial [Trachymyrmex septentrionalis]